MWAKLQLNFITIHLVARTSEVGHGLGNASSSAMYCDVCARFCCSSCAKTM